MQPSRVILVNDQDEVIATMEKMEAHQRGFLHRAFSVFIFNSKGELLLQQRALSKYHSGGLWTNTCCSHPFPGEDTLKAAQRRLEEEMGFTTPLKKIFDFVYKADFSNGLIEHEFDHVFAGEYEGPLRYNLDEVMDYRYVSIPDLHRSIKDNPFAFSAWLQIALPKIEEWWKEQYKNVRA